MSIQSNLHDSSTQGKKRIGQELKKVFCKVLWLCFNKITATLVLLAVSGTCMQYLLQIDYTSPSENIPLWMSFCRLAVPLIGLNCIGLGTLVVGSRMPSSWMFRLYLLQLTVLALIAGHFGLEHGTSSYVWWNGYPNWEWALLLTLGGFVLSYWIILLNTSE